MYVEYVRVLRAKFLGQSLFDPVQLRARFSECLPQPFDLGAHATGRHFDVIKLVPPLLVQPQHIANDNPARGWQTLELDITAAEAARITHLRFPLRTSAPLTRRACPALEFRRDRQL